MSDLCGAGTDGAAAALALADGSVAGRASSCADSQGTDRALRGIHDAQRQ